VVKSWYILPLVTCCNGMKTLLLPSQYHSQPSKAVMYQCSSEGPK